MAPEQPDGRRQTVLLVDSDVLVRHEVAEYLRHCGYEVIEGATTHEAARVLSQLSRGVDALLCDGEAAGEMTGFALARWVRDQHPDVPVLLAGDPERATEIAGDLCEAGPELQRPYDPEVVLDQIRRRLAMRERNRGG